MTHIAKHPEGNYGIRLNDGTWMKTIGGSDWHQTLSVCREVLPLVIDETVSKPIPISPPPSETAMRRAHRRQVSLNKASRRHGKRSRRGNTVKY